MPRTLPSSILCTLDKDVPDVHISPNIYISARTLKMALHKNRGTNYPQVVKCLHRPKNAFFSVNLDKNIRSSHDSREHMSYFFSNIH